MNWNHDAVEALTLKTKPGFMHAGRTLLAVYDGQVRHAKFIEMRQDCDRWLVIGMKAVVLFKVLPSRNEVTELQALRTGGKGCFGRQR